MGKRVHVVSKQREYGDSEAFNWANEEFKDLLRDLGCNVCEQDEYSDDFELLTAHYEVALNILKRMKENPDLTNEDIADLKYGEDDDYDAIDPDMIELDDVKDDIEKLGYSLEELINVLENFYDERDKNSSWIQFSAW